MSVLYLIGMPCYYLGRLVDKCISAFYIRHTKNRLLFCGKNVSFSRRVQFAHCENIYIGNNTYINGGELVAGKNSKITIGDNCLISYNIHFRTITHKYDKSDVLIREQGCIERDIVIGNNVWIGYGTQVLGGVVIGDNNIIGAGSIVTKNIPDNEVWAGVPAKFIKKR